MVHSHRWLLCYQWRREVRRYDCPFNSNVNTAS